MNDPSPTGPENGPPAIRVLPEVLANQIAAGEVVERPASVVKELVENSLDAGADRIEVRIDGGGKRSIQVLDNGHGMTDEQARLCLERHATSKIITAEDLFNIHTLGFRGEALPAIASVSHLGLESRVRALVDGVRITLKGGKERNESRIVMPPGTRITVKNLFFNTPARLKFMRTERTEAGHVIELIHRLALAHDHCGFKLLHNNRSLLDIQSGGSGRFLEQRLAAVFGKDFIDNCLEFEGGQEQTTLSGWIGLPTLNRANAGAMHLFVNGRWVRDKTIIQAVRESYRDLMARNRYPVLALFLRLPPRDVDVNVHPTKQEVRFHQQSFIFSLVRRTLAGALASMGSRTYHSAAESPPPAPPSFVTDPPPTMGEPSGPGEGGSADDADGPAETPPDFITDPPHGGGTGVGAPAGGGLETGLLGPPGHQKPGATGGWIWNFRRRGVPKWPGPGGPGRGGRGIRHPSHPATAPGRGTAGGNGFGNAVPSRGFTP